MNILEHRALRGPNYYSRYLAIFMRLDIGELEQRPSDTMPDVVARLTEQMPTLAEHRCSIGRRGGFLERLARGTWAGHVVEHVAIELQNLIGFSVGYGTTGSLEVTHGDQTLYQGAVGNISEAAFDAGENYNWGLFAYLYDDHRSGQHFEVLNFWVED